MNLLLLILLGIGMALVPFFLQAWILRDLVRLFRIGPISYRRALATWLAILLAIVFVSVIGGVLELMATSLFVSIPQLVWGWLVLWCVAHLGMIGLVVKWLLHAPFGRAVGIGLTAIVSHVALSVGLALSLKLLICEAFVIPTGGMAPVLLGKHADVQCDNCGWGYPVSLSDWIPLTVQQRRPVSIVCPNCGQPDTVTVDTKLKQGDRIVVCKLVRPKRWDLTVFRYPEEPTTQFVQRVIGFPDEQIELMEGDAFVDGRRLPKAPEEAPSMWLAVHDTDFAPRLASLDGPCWKPTGTASKWRRDAGNWTFSGLDSETEVLAFAGEVTNHLAYNGEESHFDHEEATRVFVGDLLVECPIAQFSGEGSMGFQWEFRGSRVTATVSSTGHVELVVSEQREEDAEQEGKTRQVQGDLSRPLSAQPRLAFAVRDGEAYVLEEGKPVAQLAVGPQDLASAQARAKQRVSPCRIGITARRCSLSIPRIQLFRDVYYCRAEEMQGPLYAFSNRAELDEESFWMLGDNSQQSKDSRFFGPVCKKAITGVATWLYWPLERSQHFQ